MIVLLLGVGMQGKAALYDLAVCSEIDRIIAADSDLEMLKKHIAGNELYSKVECKHFDASDPGSILEILTAKPDVVVELLPKRFQDNVARVVIESGINLVNTLFVSDQIKKLNDTAIKNEVCILPEFGLDPGIDLVMMGDAKHRLDTIDEIYSYGAGIPESSASDNPLKYKVSWSLEGVLGAYRRPARIIRDGKIHEILRNDVFKPENFQLLEIEDVGELEVYHNGDILPYLKILGLEIELINSASRFTMRWPGHCDFWHKLLDLHLLDDDPVHLNGQQIDKIQYMAAALEPHLKYAPDERDLVVVRVEAAGLKDGKRMRLRYELVDYRDLETGLTAMSRTVGFSAAIGAQMIGSGHINGKGLLSPLTDVPYQQFVKQLMSRGIKIRFEEISE